MKTVLAIVLLIPLFSVAQSPGGVDNTNLYLWVKANDGVIATGGNVSQWTNKAATTMTTQPSKTASSNVTLNNNGINYNPTVVFNGASSEMLQGTFATVPANPALLFGVAKKSSAPDVSLSNMYSLGAAGASGIAYTTAGNGYAVDRSGGVCAVTADVRDRSVLARIDYNSVSAVSGATSALNGLLTTGSACTSGLLGTASGSLQVGGRTYGTQPTRVFAGEIAEVVHFNTDNLPNGTDINKVESYLAVKYGLTLVTDYTSAAGTTVYSSSTYGNNIIGIARDDNSALDQRQSHYANDSVRLYLSTLAANNAANSGSFAANGQFVMMGDNNASLSFNPSNTEYPSGVSALSRLNREWKITNTGFAGTFSIDIKPTAGSFDPARIRVLIDDDGDFSNATFYTPVISATGGVITVSGLTTAMIATGSTRYFTLAYTLAPGNISNNLTYWIKADAGITQSAGRVSQWNDQSAQVLHTTAPTAEQPTVAADTINYYPVVNFDGLRVLKKSSGIAYNTLVNAVSGSSSNTTGSILTVSRVNTASGNIFSQWNTDPCGNYVVSSAVNSNTTEIGGRSFPTGGHTVSTGHPFMATALETSGTNNALHYLNGGDLKTTTNTSLLICTPNQLIRVGSGLTGSVAEVIVYNVKLADQERRKIESYMAIKYGITMSNVGGGLFGDYISTAATTVWDASDNSSYHRQVIGVGRDDNTGLLQKQSHTEDDTTRIYISNLQSTNLANNGSFSSDTSFLLMGNNGGKMERDDATLTEFPPGNGIYRRLDREWKVTNTNFSDNFSIDMKLSTSYVTAIDIVLLVDNDGDFSNAQVFTPAVSFSGGVLTLTGISTAMIPANSTRYITIASINSRSALPVKLVDFTASLTSNKKVKLNWRTATEINSDYFAIERAGSDMQWQEIAQVRAAGNSIQLLSYLFTDNSPLQGASYYRLRMVDADGKFSYSPVRIITLDNMDWLALYPQPAQEQITLEGSIGNVKELVITDMTGRLLTGKIKLVASQADRATFDITGLPPGMYLIKTTTGAAAKLIKK